MDGKIHVFTWKISQRVSPIRLEYTSVYQSFEWRSSVYEQLVNGSSSEIINRGTRIELNSASRPVGGSSRCKERALLLTPVEWNSSEANQILDTTRMLRPPYTSILISQHGARGISGQKRKEKNCPPLSPINPIASSLFFSRFIDPLFPPFPS